jgi:hypothetical protein
MDARKWIYIKCELIEEAIFSPPHPGKIAS